MVSAPAFGGCAAGSADAATSSFEASLGQKLASSGNVAWQVGQRFTGPLYQGRCTGTSLRAPFTTVWDRAPPCSHPAADGLARTAQRFGPAARLPAAAGRGARPSERARPGGCAIPRRGGARGLAG